MTDTATTTGRVTITGPCDQFAWCRTKHDGPDPTAREHYSEGAYVPATASPESGVTDHTGAVFPTVGVGVVASPQDGIAPSVSIHLSGPDHDDSVDLHPWEARALLDALTQALGLLEGEDRQ